MQLFADIASGETDWADIFFLIAVIIAVLSALASYAGEHQRFAGPLLSAAVAFAALGLLVL